MMPSDPIPSAIPSSLAVTLLAEPATAWQPARFLTEQGQWYAALRYDRREADFTVQGPPAALRELAAALVVAAELAEQAAPASDQGAGAGVGGAR
jgi:hypothetical protein